MNIIGHFKTITSHKLMVMRYCFRVGLYWRGLMHDLSKYTPTEFIPGAKYYQGNRSPNNAEREDKGYSTAWLHHKGRNRHHLEYWTDYALGDDKRIVPVEMPKIYVAEMLCDRIAASRIYKKEAYTDASPYEYFMRSKEQNVIHPKTKELLLKLLIMLKDEGEDATLEYVKRELVKKK
ncbi:MAG: catalase [Oscillospiraceae bacterium]|nr:catalase [Oscillospiraceae bacterium]